MAHFFPYQLKDKQTLSEGCLDYNRQSAKFVVDEYSEITVGKNYGID